MSIGIGIRKLSVCVGLVTLGAALVLQGAEPKSPADLLKVSLKRPAVRSTLAEAVADLAKQAQVNIAVDWQGLLETGVKPDSAVALPPTEATLDKLVDQMLSAVATKGNPLACRAIDDRLVITTQARAIRKGARLMVDGGAATSRPAAEVVAGQGLKAAAVGGGDRVNFDKTPLSQVVEFLRKAGGNLNIHVNYKALETAGISDSTPITLNVTDITVKKALDLLVEQLSGDKNKFDSVYWDLQEGVIEITTGTALDSKNVTRTFDMGELLAPIPDAAGPRMNLGMQTGGTTGNGSNNTSNTTNGGLFGQTNTTEQQTGGVANGQARTDAQNKLIKMIQKSIGDDMWQEQGGKGSITFLRNTMVVTQSRLGWLLLDKANMLR
jgi:hypothetical protein